MSDPACPYTFTDTTCGLVWQEEPSRYMAIAYLGDSKVAMITPNYSTSGYRYELFNCYPRSLVHKDSCRDYERAKSRVEKAFQRFLDEAGLVFAQK